MTHVEEGVLQAYLDAEVTDSACAEIENHVQSCGVCTRQLERMRQAAELFSAALRATDVAAPSRAPQVTIASSRATRMPVSSAAPRRAFARAAMFVVGLAAVASATVPGSPVRAWISQALARVGLIETQRAARPVPDTEAPARTSTESTDFFIEPADGTLRVVLTQVNQDVRVTVELTEGAAAHIQAWGAASKARFVRGVGRFEVIGVNGGTVTVQIPRDIKQATVEQDGRTIFSTGR